MRKLAALLWVLGMSLRGVATALPAFGTHLSHMSVWRDMQEQAEQLEKRRRWQGARVLGIDGLYPLGWEKCKHAVLVAVGLGSGQPAAIGYLDEANPQAVQRLGVSVVVIDDLAGFRSVTHKLGVKHQVCQFHVRRWVGRALRELGLTTSKDWLWVLDEINRLLAELPPEGSRRLFELWEQIPERRAGRDTPLSPLDQLRFLLIRLSEHWDSYRVFTWQNGVPWTNNATEQAIGRMEMRARTMRGFKSWQGMQAGLLLSGTRLAF